MAAITETFAGFLWFRAATRLANKSTVRSLQLTSAVFRWKAAWKTYFPAIFTGFNLKQVLLNIYLWSEPHWWLRSEVLSQASLEG